MKMWPPLRSGALCIAALMMPAAAQAGVYAKEGCQITVPGNWVASKSRIASPDKKVWASVMSAGSAAEIVRVETSLKATRVAEDGRIILMASSASFGGLTNRQFHAITKTTPACLADVTVPAGSMEAAAKAIALTIRPAK
jgi:hypothetical protein